MPENSSSKKTVRGSQRAPRRRPDYSTLVGIAIALGGIVGGLLLKKGNIQDIAQITAAMIVLGGTFGAVLVSTPLPVVLRGFRALSGVFFEAHISPAALIQTLIQLASAARKYGIVSLETEVSELPDPFLRKAMGLAVDGADLKELRQMMEIDIASLEHSGEDEAKVWESAGGFAPTIGIIGAVMGLIQVMKNLDDIKAVGHGIAVAFVATLYGVGLANILFLPAAAKLRARLREAVLLKELTLEGVAAISQGLNPTMIRMRLDSYHGPTGTPAGPRRTSEAEAVLGTAAAGY